MSWGAFFYPHTVLVRDIRRGGGMGDTHGEARELRAEIKDEQRLVRAADGSEVVSSSTVKVPLPEDIQPGSLVTVWAGKAGEREAEVLAVARHENGPPLDEYLELSLK